MRDVLASEALRRRRVFENLGDYLKVLVDVVRGVDPRAEVYLFGSVVEGRHTYSSDIDVLIVTDARPEEVITRLWRHGVEDPFEFHVIPRKDLPKYARRARLVKVA